MTDEEKQKINHIIQNEGFDYAFNYYSDFDDIQDEEFHKLRRNFIHARDTLEAYVEGTE